MNLRLDEQIVMILEDFNFKAVHTICTALGTTWKRPGKPASTPSLSELQGVALQCLEKVSDSSDENALFSLYEFEAEKINGVLELRYVPVRTNTLGPLLNPRKG